MAGASPQGEDGANGAGDLTSSQTTKPASAAPGADAHGHGHVVGKAGKFGLILGAIGVVFGDIGTSPLYALREAIEPCPAAAWAATWLSSAWSRWPSGP